MKSYKKKLVLLLVLSMVLTPSSFAYGIDKVLSNTQNDNEDKDIKKSDAIEKSKVDENQVSFNDPNFENAIRDIINRPKGAIYKKDLKRIYELELINKNINDIEGIQYFENLKKLDLSFNKIEDIRPLSKLKMLEELKLMSNKIEKLEGIED